MVKVFAIALMTLTVLTASGATALHREDIPVIQRLAHDLENQARSVRVFAEAQTHHFSRREARMIRSLRHFEGQASLLHGTVESYFTSPAQVNAVLQHLNDDADSVERVIYRSHALGGVVNEWNRAALLLRRINGYFYGGHGGHAPAFDHH